MTKKKSGSKNPQPQPQRELTLSEKWTLWRKRNEKVLWVVLLVLIAPLMAFTVPVDLLSRSDPSVATVYGEPVLSSAVQTIDRRLSAVSRVAPGAFAGTAQLIGGGRRQDPYAYYIFLETAERQGIRVSDEELKERIREIWRAGEAARFAAESAGGNQSEWFGKYSQRLQELNEQDVFDAADWKETVRQTRLPLHVLEGTLRDLYKLAKLQAYVAGTVKVSAKEAYEEFLKGEEKRQISWAAFKTPDALREKVATEIVDEDLKAHFEANEYEFYQPAAVRPSYLLVPKDHFRAEAEKDLARPELEEFYTENRNEYRKPVILSDEGGFALRTREEQAALDAKIYQPLSEVEEEVTEKFLDDKAAELLTAFTRQLRGRLFPPAAGEKKPATPEELVKEFPFLQTGVTGYATQADAEEVLGELYTSQVEQWFRDLAPKPGEAPKTEISPRRWSESVDGGELFYTSVELRTARQPRFDEVTEEVRESLVDERARTAVVDALREATADLAGDAAKQKVDAIIADGIEVAVGEAKFSVKATGGFVPATEKIGKFGLVRFENPESTDSSSSGVDGAPAGERHPASTTIRTAGFEPSEIGGFGVGADDNEDECYLVRFDEREAPEPKDFERDEPRYRNQLRRERETNYFTEWKRDTIRRADPSTEDALEPVDGVTTTAAG